MFSLALTIFGIVISIFLILNAAVLAALALLGIGYLIIRLMILPIVGPIILIFVTFAVGFGISALTHNAFARVVIGGSGLIYGVVGLSYGVVGLFSEFLRLYREAHHKRALMMDYRK